MFGLKVILIGTLLHCVNSLSDYFFVVSPNVIRYEYDETVYVSIFGDKKNVGIEVWLQYRDWKFSSKTVYVTDQKYPVPTSVSVREGDIFRSIQEEEIKPRSLKLCARRLNDAAENCRDVDLSYNSGYIIVQTDKSIYAPHQTVSIRVLALNEAMQAIRNQTSQISIDIVSPSKRTLGRKIDNMTVDSGFYKYNFVLPSYAEKGVWTAKAFYKGRYETVARSLFEVAEYVVPTFGVTIDVSEPFILRNSKETIIITVTAEYVYGKRVDGNARLNLSLKDKSGDSKPIRGLKSQKLHNGQTRFNITAEDILNSEAVKNMEFPAGARLMVTATVVESATGKEEAIYTDSTTFAAFPFVFKFLRSKKYYRPGMEYTFKVDMMKVNGEPAENEQLTVQVFSKSNLLQEIRNVTTDSQGRANAFHILQESNNIFLKVIASNGQESDPFYISPYLGKNQVQVEHKISGGVMQMSVSNNVQLDGTYTGMLFMIVARGKIVKATFKDTSIMSALEIDEQLQDLVNPSGRLFVFYVDRNTNEVVADSVKFELDGKCRGRRNLVVKPKQVIVLPGANSDISITGEPFSHVGLNVMDKALLLLNKEGILHKNMMFQAMESHDLGCGPGSGNSNGDVFKNAGLTLVTNAALSNIDTPPRRNCVASKRKKRDTGCLYGAEKNCCEYGIEYANTIYYETEADQRATIDTYATCYAMARNLTRDENIPTRCIMAYFHSCQTELEYLISEITDEIVSKSLDEISKYDSDLALLNKHRIALYNRKEFRESFQFEEVQLDSNGNRTIPLLYPDSITDWMIQAIGITKDKGMCIADPVDVRAFREFFIQLDLPYKATRLEMFNVKATIFNYGNPTDQLKQARIYMEGVDGLCYSGESGIPSEPTQVELEPNSARMVTFPIVPLKEGLFAVTVTAVVTNLGIPQADGITKTLHVVHEGIPERKTILLCLDPNNQTNDCDNGMEVTQKWNRGVQTLEVDLTLPTKHIPGTGSASAYIFGVPFENVVRGFVSGVEWKFTEPYGCQEQTISSYTPNVFAMLYLRKTGLAISANVQKGTDYIRQGVERLVNYRQSDGSYRSVNSHVWLTSFVAKMFCHSKLAVPDAVDPNLHLYPTIRWLNQRVYTARNVHEHENRYYYYDMGQLNTATPALTAYWLITMLECGVLQEEIRGSVEVAMTYLEQQSETYLKNDPYVLAISTYALALGQSKKLEMFARWLKEIKHQNSRQTYWGIYGSGRSYNIETTAYALLAMLKMDDMRTSESIVRWLTRQQSVSGAFATTQDTVIGLQGLSEYSVRKYAPNTDLRVTLLPNNQNPTGIILTSLDYDHQRIVDKIPVESKDNKLTVKVEGTNGEGRMMIELRYNRPANANETCPFNISKIEIGDVEAFIGNVDTDITKRRKCDVCGRCSGESPSASDSALTTAKPDNTVHSNFGRRKRQLGISKNATLKCIRFTVSTKSGSEHGMSMVLFGLETGVSVIAEDLEKLTGENTNLDQYELPADGKSYVAFYLNTLTSEPNHFVFRIEDNFDGEVRSRQPATVKVFDYYKPEFTCLKMYGTGPDQENAFGYKCTDTQKKQCKCIQNTCAQPVEKEIARIDKPAVKLVKYTCTTEKANFAVLVKVINVNETDSATNEKRAIAELTKMVHKGTYLHLPGDKLDFAWKAYCSHPNLENERSYYIIGKDNHYPYRLMETALVIQLPEDTSGTKYLAAVLKKYEQIMLQTGCMS